MNVLKLILIVLFEIDIMPLIAVETKTIESPNRVANIKERKVVMDHSQVIKNAASNYVEYWKSIQTMQQDTGKQWVDKTGVKWTYKLFSRDNFIVLTDVETDKTEISTPRRIDGHPVKCIRGLLNDFSPFSTKCKAPNLKCVVVSHGVEEIIDSFKWCNTIERVVLPESVHSIGNPDDLMGGSFQNCERLTQINLPSKLNFTTIPYVRRMGD